MRKLYRKFHLGLVNKLKMCYTNLVNMKFMSNDDNLTSEG